MFFELVAVVTKIHQDGEISICDPIFKKTSKNTTKYFRRKNDGSFIEVSIKKYGEPVQLPASKEKIKSRKEYLVLFNRGQNFVRMDGNPIIKDKNLRDYFYIPSEITVGIKFPNTFICILRDNLSVDELKEYL